jgi:hypothetical protein
MKHLRKFNESLEEDLEQFYGKTLMLEYTNLINDIKDRCYDLKDLGFDVEIDWSYSTRIGREKTPKVEIHITGESSEYDKSWNEVVLPTIEIIRGLIRDEGFSSGSGFVKNGSGSIKTTYKIIFAY